LRQLLIDATSGPSSGGLLWRVWCSKWADRSEAVGTRSCELVWGALPWPAFSKRGDLRSGQVYRRAPDPAFWHPSAGAPARSRSQRCGSHQRPWPVCEIADHRSFSRSRRHIGNKGRRRSPGCFGGAEDTASGATSQSDVQARGCEARSACCCFRCRSVAQRCTATRPLAQEGRASCSTGSEKTWDRSTALTSRLQIFETKTILASQPRAAADIWVGHRVPTVPVNRADATERAPG